MSDVFLKKQKTKIFSHFGTHFNAFTTRICDPPEGMNLKINRQSQHRAAIFRHLRCPMSDVFLKKQKAKIFSLKKQRSWDTSNANKS